MSYEIIYDKQFIKVCEDGYIPMVLAGSNNCTEWSPNSTRERRERSWFSWSPQNKTIFSLGDLIANATESRDSLVKNYDDYDDKSFGSYSGIAINGSYGTFGSYLSMFKTGCKKALTIEQLKKYSVNVTLTTGHRYNNLEEKYGLKPFTRVAKSNEDFIDVYALMVEYLKGTGIMPQVNFSYMSEDTPKRIRREMFPKVKRQKGFQVVDGYWTVGCFYNDNDGNLRDTPRWYLKKFTSRSVVYGYDPQLKYLTEKEAKARCSRSAKKTRGFEFVLKPVFVEGKRELYI